MLRTSRLSEDTRTKLACSNTETFDVKVLAFGKSAQVQDHFLIIEFHEYAVSEFTLDMLYCTGAISCKCCTLCTHSLCFSHVL